MLGLLIGAAALAGGFVAARNFVRSRLRYVDAVRKPAAPLLAGLAATAVALPVAALPLPVTVKILAVADAFETLQMATPVRPAFPKWSALEEVEKGAGKTFAKDAVRALRTVSARPEATADQQPGLRVV